MNAMKGMQGYKIANKTLLCQLSNSNHVARSSNIYIKPLHQDMTESMFLSPLLFLFLFVFLNFTKRRFCVQKLAIQQHGGCRM